MPRVALILLVVALSLAGCADAPPPTVPAPTVPTADTRVSPPPSAVTQDRPLAADPAQMATDLVADESALRDPAAPNSVLAAAAHRQQAAYRILGRHPEWDSLIRPHIPADLREVVDRNIDARRQLSAMGRPKDTLPAWRIVEPRPAQELLGYYREAQSAFGVGWNYLAAINFIETAFGRVAGVSTAGAQGPMQFMPATFAAYGAGGDILAPRDSIMAAGRYLAANGFERDPDHALYRYNNSQNYVRAVHDYAAVIAAHPLALAGYHRWSVYYNTTSGDMLLPVGYSQDAPVPVSDYTGVYSAPYTPASAEIRISPRSAEILDRLLAARRQTPAAGGAALSAALSQPFLGTAYGADTLVGSQDVPEQLVIDLERVDCFTLADYIEALKRAETRDQFIDALTAVRYQDGLVGFASRRHFFTDWSAGSPPIATDVTADVSAAAITVTKKLNQRDDGGTYLPGLPVSRREVTYIPAERVDTGVVDRLHPGDYVGAYAEDGGLDVTHVGMFLTGPDGPVLRNASSLSKDQQVVDSPFPDYVGTVPGIVVLRPVT